jgi:hypothetical protein
VWRPKKWKLPRFFKHAMYATPQLQTVYEAGADAMHQADVEWLIEKLNPHIISLIEDRLGKEWKEFTGKS